MMESLDDPRVLKRHKTISLDLETDDNQMSDELMPESELLTTGMVKILEHGIPAYIRTSGWHRYYSKPTHGSSFHTLLSSCYKRGEIVVIIEDHNHGVFGCYFAADLEKHEDFFGTGDSFLFKVTVV